MNETRRAIFDRLSGDATLTGLLAAPGNIYHQVAPQTATFPVVVFHKAAGTPVLQFVGAYVQNDLWSVRAISQGSSSTAAEEIAARVDVLLDNAELAITGRVHLYLRRDSDIDMSEQDGADTFAHVGALYRLWTQPT
jgi:hypothetical protein